MTARIPGLTAPEPLGAHHDVTRFHSGEQSLDNWLRRRAWSNEAEGGSRTFVLCKEREVVRYYSLAASSVASNAAPGRVRRNMPDPVPVILLGRLAIDQSWQGKGLGADLLRDAVVRVLAAGTTVGVRAILVHALSADAKAFYERHGFQPSPVDSMMLMITVVQAERMLAPGL